MHLKPLAVAALMAAGSLSAPIAPARADDCLIDAVRECNAEFPPKDYYLIAIRGWCYSIHYAICKTVN